MDIKNFKTNFDILFFEELEKLITEAVAILGTHPADAYITYIHELAQHGKRIRPYNAALIYTIYSHKDWRDIKHALFGLEIIHLMALVHDDVMDNSDKRHGTLSMHGYIKDDLMQKSTAVDQIQTSNSLAILVGDLLFAWAYKEFNKQHLSQESWDIVHMLVEEVILGQTLDVYNPVEPSTTNEAIIKKMLLKTARYTFTRPLQLGLTCAFIKTTDASWIEDFGDSLGTLFQIQDDIFDIVGSYDTIKKEPLGDIKNGIHTLISTHVAQHTPLEDKEIWHHWFGNTTIPPQREIVEFLEKNGALEFARSYITTEQQKSERAIETSALQENSKTQIKNLLTMITKRNH